MAMFKSMGVIKCRRDVPAERLYKGLGKKGQVVSWMSVERNFPSVTYLNSLAAELTAPTAMLS
jgi:hypothetical protein